MQSGNHTGMVRGVINGLKPGSWDQPPCTGATKAWIGDDHINTRSSLSTFHERKQVYFSINDQGGVNHADWKPNFCLHGKKPFSASWILLKASRHMPMTDFWPPLPPHLPHRHQYWNNQHWSASSASSELSWYWTWLVPNIGVGPVWQHL